MKNILLLLAIIGISFYACTKEQPSTNAQLIWGIESEEDAYQQLGEYADFVFTESSGLNIRDMHNSTRPDYSFTNASAYYRDSWTAELSDGGTFYINDIPLLFDETDNVYYPYGDNSYQNQTLSNLMAPLLGQQISFKLKKGTETVFEEMVYLPERITIQSSSVLDEETGRTSVTDGAPLAISWNSDANNDKGVLLVLNWTGDIAGVHPINFERTPVQRAVLVEDDTGNYAIPATFFADLPPNALFQITIMRGTIEKTVGTLGNSFQLYGLCETNLHLIKK